MSHANPFLTESALPYHLPEFSRIRLEHVEPAVAAGIEQQRGEVEAILAESAPTWENTVEALERSGKTLDRATAWFFNLQGTDATEEFEKVAEQIIPQLSAHTDWIYQNAELYLRIRDLEVPDDEQSRRLHRLIDVRFTRRGTALDADGQRRLSEINQRLAVLSEQFGRNLLRDTRDLAVRFESAAQLDGLPQSRIDAAQTLGEDTGRGGYVLALELPSTQSAQESLTSPASRRAVFDASRARGRELNTPLLIETVVLRAERARLLGYDTHADYVIAEETAGTAAAVRELLEDLSPAASANAEAERKLAGENAGQELGAADWPFYAARLREEDAGVPDAELRQYFPLDRVLVDGVFHAASRLYGIEVRRREDLDAYREDVQVWEVLDTDGAGLGLLLTDYAARETKRGGAWMSTFTDQAQLTGSRAIVVNVMSIDMPADGSSPLLSVDEVTTLFHEFGHALHGLLSDVRYPSISGTNVPRDWVEFPSQINENWAFDPEVVSNYARHIDTGAPLPTDYLEVLARQRQAGQGFATAEYLAAAIIDLAWHSLTPEQAAEVNTVADVDAFESRALAAAGLQVDALAPRYASTYFNHIFAGGYSAGYYSYLWAEALDADGFEWFTERKAAGAGVDKRSVREAGQRFRDLVLSRGAGSDYAAAFTELRGRGRSIDALLARRGLAGTKVG